jgi:hypothetical protein
VPAEAGQGSGTNAEREQGPQRAGNHRRRPVLKPMKKLARIDSRLTPGEIALPNGVRGSRLEVLGFVLGF